MKQNTDRKVIPFNTGKVQIGRSYQPRTTPAQAEAIERHAKPSAFVRWLAYSGLALVAFVLIAGRT